jgi:hypothetical protein
MSLYKQSLYTLFFLIKQKKIMIKLSINIQSLNDVEKGKPAIEGITKENIIESEDVSVGILESGTVSGQTVIMFAVKIATPDGEKYVVSQLTENIFNSLVGALKGANERFKEEKF